MRHGTLHVNIYLMLPFHSTLSMMKVQFFKYSFIFGVLFLFYFVQWPSNSQVGEGGGQFLLPGSTQDGGTRLKPPIILIWTTIFRRRTLETTVKFLPANQAALEGCELTFDRARRDEADALLFHFHFGDLNLSDMPKGARDDEQVWIIMGMENPLMSPTRLLPSFNNTFNWTMTYRLDSDVKNVYGEKIEIQDEYSTEENRKIERLLSGKQKLALGVFSNCESLSNREALIAKLKHLLPIGSVDILGKCGKPFNVIHDLGPVEIKFWSEQGSLYKFYLAFENSICVDYITEKFWRALKHGMVPVVYGGGNYSLVGPPNSFIDVREFSNVTMLADYLLMLDQNPQEYRKYFEWRKRFRIVDDEGIGIRALCRKLKEFKESRLSGNYETKVYKDLKEWWNFEDSSNHRVACSSDNYI